MTRRQLVSLAFATALAAACSRKSRGPDFEAYCAVAAPCEDKSTEACLEDRRHVWDVNRARGCGAEDEAVLACGVEHGRCQRNGSLSAFIPGGECDDVLQRKDACLERTRR